MENVSIAAGSTSAALLKGSYTSGGIVMNGSGR